MWKRLIHANIVPFIGVILDPLQFVSEWMPGGDLTSYICLNPRANRIDLVSPVLVPPRNRALFFCQLVDVARGLHYLHLCNVIHGDLKGVSTSPPGFWVSFIGTSQPNILVDSSGCARITDFGLARNQEITYQTTTSYGHTARWTAPEVLGGDGVVSKKADVFAFAMVMIEVRCEKLLCIGL